MTGSPGGTSAWDVLALACLLVGALFCLSAAVGLLRFPDVLARLHAATKPQTVGLLLTLLGVGLGLRTWAVVGPLVLVMAFQLLTTPVGAQALARTTYRTRRFRRGRLVVDDLARDLQTPDRARDPDDRGGSGRP